MKNNKRVSILDVAREANVSYQTVSRVINNKDGVGEETRKRVLSIIQQLDYQPNDIARSLVVGRTFTLGCISESLTDYVLSEITENIKSEALAKGYFVLIGSAPNKEEARGILDQFLRKRVDGLIVFDPSMDQRDQILTDAVDHGLPIVYIGAFPQEKNGSAIRPDDDQGGRLAAEELLRLGHQKIAIITGPMNEACAQDRWLGFSKVLKDSSFPLDRELTEQCNWSPEAGYLAANHLFEKNIPFSGLFCESDQIALGAMRAIKEHSLRIPEDISVIGFDDIPLANFLEPPLTTIRQDLKEIGREAARLLIDRIEDPRREPDCVWVNTSLVQRSSTGPAPERN
jgi:DNA-binding LacI/PurR family transcriptional regulator